MENGAVGTVVKITAPDRQVYQRVELVPGQGMESQGQSGKHRDLSLLSEETWADIDKRPEKGLCTARFHENIRTKGIALHEFPVGTQIQMGEAVIRISRRGKPCHDECALNQNGLVCPLAHQVVFATVEKAGEICIGSQCFSL